jgi:hypothetical protein
LRNEAILQVGVEIGTGELGLIEAIVQDTIASDMLGELQRNVFDERAALPRERKGNAEALWRAGHSKGRP